MSREGDGFATQYVARETCCWEETINLALSLALISGGFSLFSSAKYNSYCPAKNHLPIQIILCISSVLRIIILDKPKSSGLPATDNKNLYQSLNYNRGYL
jgi:hypothetical protein